MDPLAADWIGLCRRAVAAQREIFDGAPEMEERSVYEGQDLRERMLAPTDRAPSSSCP